MNYKKVIEHLKTGLTVEEENYIKKSFTELEKLKEKEKPQEVIIEKYDLSITYDFDILCPKCRGLIGSTNEHYKYNYCFFCGQKLDWREEDLDNE